jgi:predicted XRE-type DNA-binding protein
MEVMMTEAQTFDSVFDALADTPAEAANLQARSELLSTLKSHIRSWNVAQDIAAARLGITRPRLNDLLQGKMAKFSLDALVNIATAAGLTVHIHVARAA